MTSNKGKNGLSSEFPLIFRQMMVFVYVSGADPGFWEGGWQLCGNNSENAKFVTKAVYDFLENVKFGKSMKDKTLLSEKVGGEGVTCHPSHRLSWIRPCMFSSKNKFAYLTMKNSGIARFARAFLIFVCFIVIAVFVLSATWNNLF